MRSDRTRDEIKNLKEKIKELEDICCQNLDRCEREEEAKNILIKELETVRHDLSRQKKKVVRLTSKNEKLELLKSKADEMIISLTD